MNERIQELADQAGFILHQLTGLPDCYIFNKEKFAELIVRDCARTAGLMEHEGRKGIGAQILDNFGVRDD